MVLDPEALAARRIAGFAATLRDVGFVAGFRETEDAARVLASPLAARAGTLRAALRSLFCGRRADWERFDAIFDAAFLGRALRQAVRISSTPPASGPRSLREIAADRRAGPEAGQNQLATLAFGIGETADGSAAMRGGMSTTESGTERDMRAIADPDALAATDAVASRLVAQLRTRHVRRRRRARRGSRLDLRRTIRASLGHGGMPFELAWRKPRPKPLRIVLLLDVSGSMSSHTPLFLRFALGVVRHAVKSEAFLVHTRLVEVGAAMRDRDRFRALDRLTLLSKGVGGGTRLGESLAAFNRNHAAHALAGRSVCFIASDGYETADPALLGHEMAALRRRCRRIVWLNPAADSAGYEPVARGMQAAIPHIRLLAPAGTLESLAALEDRLGLL